MSTPATSETGGLDSAPSLVAMLLGEPPSLEAAEREFVDGRYSRALEHLTGLAGERQQVAADSARVLEQGAEACLRSGRPYEAIAWAEQLAKVPGKQATGVLLGAAAALKADECAQARQLLTAVDGSSRSLTDDESATAHRLWCLLYTREEDDQAAWASARTAVALRVDDADVWQAIAVIASRADVEVDEAAAMVTETALLAVVGHLSRAHPAGADRVLEALWERWPGDRRILTALTILGARLPLERSLEWSARLRAAGLEDHCAVLGRAAHSAVPPRERIQAAAVAVAAFSDQRGLQLLEQAVQQVPNEALGEVLQDLAELDVPPALESFVVAAASTPARALRVASLLADAGASDAAVSVVGHAATLADPGSAQWHAAVAASLPGAAARRLRSVVQAAGAEELAQHLRS